MTPADVGPFSGLPADSVQSLPFFSYGGRYWPVGGGCCFSPPHRLAYSHWPGVLTVGRIEETTVSRRWRPKMTRTSLFSAGFREGWRTRRPSESTILTICYVSAFVTALVLILHACIN